MDNSSFANFSSSSTSSGTAIAISSTSGSSSSSLNTSSTIDSGLASSAPNTSFMSSGSVGSTPSSTVSNSSASNIAAPEEKGRDDKHFRRMLFDITDADCNAYININKSIISICSLLPRVYDNLEKVKSTTNLIELLFCGDQNTARLNKRLGQMSEEELALRMIIKLSDSIMQLPYRNVREYAGNDLSVVLKSLNYFALKYRNINLNFKDNEKLEIKNITQSIGNILVYYIYCIQRQLIIKSQGINILVEYIEENKASIGIEAARDDEKLVAENKRLEEGINKDKEELLRIDGVMDFKIDVTIYAAFLSKEAKVDIEPYKSYKKNILISLDKMKYLEPGSQVDLNPYTDRRLLQVYLTKELHEKLVKLDKDNKEQFQKDIESYYSAIEVLNDKINNSNKTIQDNNNKFVSCNQPKVDIVLLEAYRKTIYNQQKLKEICRYYIEVINEVESRDSTVACIIDFITTIQEKFISAGANMNASQDEFNKMVFCEGFIQTLESYRNNIIHCFDRKASFDQAYKASFGYASQKLKQEFILLLKALHNLIDVDNVNLSLDMIANRLHNRSEVITRLNGFCKVIADMQYNVSKQDCKILSQTQLKTYACANKDNIIIHSINLAINIMQAVIKLNKNDKIITTIVEISNLETLSNKDCVDNGYQFIALLNVLGEVGNNLVIYAEKNKISSDNFQYLDKLIKVIRDFRNTFVHDRYLNEERVRAVMEADYNEAIAELQELVKGVSPGLVMNTMQDVSSSLSTQVNCVIL
jgi:hypothetical protein